MSSSNEKIQHFEYDYITFIAIPNFIQIVSVTLFFYYSILHFEDEITHIWSQKWTWGKTMFLATRYSGALFNILLIVSMIGNFDGVIFLDGHKVLNHMSRAETLVCLKGYLYAGLGMVPILLAEGVLALRVYAIYNKSRRVLIFLVFLLLCSFAVNVAQASGALTTAIENKAFKTNYQNEAFAPFKMLASCSSSTASVDPVAWAITMAIESIFFTMVFVKSRKNSKPDLPSSVWCDLLAFLAKDSTVYYAVIFVCTSFPTVISFVVEFKYYLSDELNTLFLQLNPFQAVVVTVMTLLAPQMIVNLRRKQYRYLLGSGRDGSDSSSSVSHSQGSDLTTFDSTVMDY